MRSEGAHAHWPASPALRHRLAAHRGDLSAVSFHAPFAVVELALRWRWPGFQNLYDDWANFLWYSLFFVGGFRSPASRPSTS
jgi:hypothetical protein